MKCKKRNSLETLSENWAKQMDALPTYSSILTFGCIYNGSERLLWIFTHKILISKWEKYGKEIKWENEIKLFTFKDSYSYFIYLILSVTRARGNTEDTADRGGGRQHSRKYCGRGVLTTTTYMILFHTEQS